MHLEGTKDVLIATTEETPCIAPIAGTTLLSHPSLQTVDPPPILIKRKTTARTHGLKIIRDPTNLFL